MDCNFYWNSTNVIPWKISPCYCALHIMFWGMILCVSGWQFFPQALSTFWWCESSISQSVMNFSFLSANACVELDWWILESVGCSSICSIPVFRHPRWCEIFENRLLFSCFQQKNSRRIFVIREKVSVSTFNFLKLFTFGIFGDWFINGFVFTVSSIVFVSIQCVIMRFTAEPWNRF